MSAVTSPTVLVVEDEPSFVEALSIGLRREGFIVAIATDGFEALDRFDVVRPDLVLLDVMLPRLSGIDVCRQLRKKSQVPIIMVTAKGSEIDTVVGLEVGADDYVTKPYRLRELVARMRAVLRRSPGDDAGELGPSAVSVGDVSLDPEEHTVVLRGEPLTLPLKEFELLHVLLANAGRVLPRDTLIDRVGQRLRRRHQDARRPRQAAALEDRAGPGEPDADRDDPGARVQVRTRVAATGSAGVGDAGVELVRRLLQLVARFRARQDDDEDLADQLVREVLADTCALRLTGRAALGVQLDEVAAPGDGLLDRVLAILGNAQAVLGERLGEQLRRRQAGRQDLVEPDAVDGRLGEATLDLVVPELQVVDAGLDVVLLGELAGGSGTGRRPGKLGGDGDGAAAVVVVISAARGDGEGDDGGGSSDATIHGHGSIRPAR